MSDVRGPRSEVRDPRSGLEGESELLRHVLAVRLGAGFRRSAGIDDAIQFDDRPSAEADLAQRGDAASHVDPAAAEFDPLIPGRRRGGTHVLQVHGLDSLAVAANRRDGIAASLMIVCDVEEQADMLLQSVSVFRLAEQTEPAAVKAAAPKAPAVKPAAANAAAEENWTTF